MAMILLVALACASVASLTTAEPCPVFPCGVGSSVNGRFTDPSDPTHELEPVALKQAYFTTGQMIYDYGINDNPINNPFGDCFEFCIAYNKDLGLTPNPSDVAHYWMYERTCEDNGGICSCMPDTVCGTPDSFSYKFYEEASGYGTYDYQVAGNYTAGKLCTGNVKGDPHFTGADGSKFDFTGVPRKSFSLISDTHLQVNGYFDGHPSHFFPASSSKTMTWIRAIGIMSGHHTVTLFARTGAVAAYGRNGYIERVEVDGNVVHLSPGQKVQLWDRVYIKWVGSRVKDGDDLVDIVDVGISEAGIVRLTVRPEVTALRTRDDAVIHFSLAMVEPKFSSAVHGVLGQTFRKDFQGRLARQHLVYSSLLKSYVVPGANAEGFIDGSVPNYQTSGLLRHDCRFCHFVRASEADAETAAAVQLMSGVGSTSPRKVLQ